jgi:hypothetical protein
VQTLELNTTSNDFTNIEQQARKLVGSHQNVALLAWWDSKRKTGGPQEACSDETAECVASYAGGHGSSHRIRVNGGTYDFFYGTPSGNYDELDREAVASAHQHAKNSGFDNVQGG